MAMPLENSLRINTQEQIKEIPIDFAVESIRIINKIPKLNAEPMYDLTDENISKLEILIDAPFMSFNGIEKYPSLEEKAAAIFCLTIRGHKFGNGNKRTAVMLLLILLYVNEKWIVLPWTDLCDLAMEIARTTNAKIDKQIEKVSKILGPVIIPPINAK